LGANFFVIYIFYRVDNDWENVKEFLGGYDIVMAIFSFFQRIIPGLSMGLTVAAFMALISLLVAAYKKIKRSNVSEDQLKI
jgi:hypothetical protein